MENFELNNSNLKLDNKYMDKKTILHKYIIYGLLGLALEIFFTGFNSLLKNDLTLEGKSYIWMFFIYGLAVFAEPIHDSIKNKNFFIRGLIYMMLIYAVELITGGIIMLLIGKCPWDYTGIGNNSIGSIISFRFIPIWFILGLLLEKVHEFLDRTISF
ncbi:hypothetical protein [Tissierella sp. Yu-01]|uniref:putative ABC transporter permease n=1 Tax=Tissierella sp. Yu-01 TaxID=3035694 RepID=UPI00240E1CF9|nr:hypothetical protein [Tissierella sp. Yu-01]WFA08821.1 hypothetical protein P3962_14010 [Tissierella sp. Yu-01]